VFPHVRPSFCGLARYISCGTQVGLLDRNITIVPAFVRDITAFEEMFPDPRTLLPQDAYLGSRPPLLPDMLDDAVSASVQVPAVQKMVVISGMQFPLAG
jgi:hypothetical protein